jgi:hypothetical protein
MADDKKKAPAKGAPAPAPAPARGMKDIITIVILGFIALFVFNKLSSYFETVSIQIQQAQDLGEETVYTQIVDYFTTAVDWYVKIATIFCAIALLGIAYSFMRLKQVQRAQSKKDAALSQKTVTVKKSPANAKWQKVLAHVNSENPAEWRLSILEADVLLEHALEAKGYNATSLGDKLKSVDAGQFKTIQAAWEAHKIRNSIAHQGADFMISQREAKRVIDLYQQVFMEFGFI